MSVGGVSMDWIIVVDDDMTNLKMAGHIPFATLCAIRDRIINTVEGVNRVAWDISEKPVATIEWE